MPELQRWTDTTVFAKRIRVSFYLLTSTRIANAWSKRRLGRKVLHWSDVSVRAYFPAPLGPFFTSPSWLCFGAAIRLARTVGPTVTATRNIGACCNRCNACNLGKDETRPSKNYHDINCISHR